MKCNLLSAKEWGPNKMMRFLIYFLLILWPLTCGAKITLRSSPVQIEGDRVTLGDLFEGLTTDSTIDVGKAPDLGKNYTLTISHLRKIARRNKIKWIPRSPKISLTVERLSQIVEKKQIVETLEKELREQVLLEDYDVELVGEIPKIHWPINKPLSIKIEDLKLSSRQNNFSAKFVIGPHSFLINGQIIAFVQVPVLNHSLNKGEIIEEKDLKWIKLPSARVNPTIILEEEALVGSTPKFLSIQPNLPIRTYEIEIPKVVKRGKPVTLVAKTACMTLETTGIAKDTGGLGDVIRVVNADSNTPLRGRIIGPNLVEIPLRNRTQLRGLS